MTIMHTPDQHIFTIDRYHLATMMVEAAKDGASEALKAVGIGDGMISQNKAWQRYGRESVIRWRQAGQITPVKHGRAYLYDTTTLEALNTTTNLK
jgi:hypothetical protein